MDTEPFMAEERIGWVEVKRERSGSGCDCSDAGD
jgi:hypothetical protein